MKSHHGKPIRYTIAPSRLGRLLLAATDHGVCALFLGDRDSELFASLREDFASAQLVRDDRGLARWLRQALETLDRGIGKKEVPLDLSPSDFQRRVWRELKSIPRGETRSYGEIARALGNPRASRAVGRACATNPVSLLIPCHRAVREDGGLGGYRWGLERKRHLLEQERAERSRELNQ